VEGPRHLRYRQQGKHRWGTPKRVEVVEHLAGSSLLPAICFVFSRKGCDDAARSLLDAGVRLTTGPERVRIRELVDQRVAHLAEDDLRALGFDRFAAALDAGVAAHHAGMVPPFKEAVEACFVEGLIKVVFATETLALGINMPARSVVIESLSKFTGEHHEDLTPSQYTQLTGRAGRRGLDPVGHALVLWSPWYGFDRVAALAASREFVLRSAFAPTYNMVVNLARRYDRERAEELLGRSFAQYQADRTLGQLVHRRARRAELLAAATEDATCDRGDVDEYRALRAEARQRAREARQEARARAADALDELVPGDVVRLAGQRLAVLSISHRKGGLRLRVVDVDARVVVLESEDLREPLARLATVSLPAPFDPRNRIVQRQVAAALRKAKVSHGAPRPAAPAVGDLDGAADHPVASCPDLSRHLQAAGERDRLARQLDELERRIDDRSSSMARRLALIERVLARRGFLEAWSLTERGEVLARTFHECDLLVATVVCDGLLDDLDPPSLAGVVSMFTYEHRSRDLPPAPWYPSALVRERAGRIEEVARQIQREEEKAGLTPTRQPDPTFLPLAHAWASGESFRTVLTDEDLSGGDFVRNVKQLIDLLRQVGEVAPQPATGTAARAAADALHRGIVAASSEVAPPAEGAGS
jgi:ATP-dependent RNA helicase HelY